MAVSSPYRPWRINQDAGHLFVARKGREILYSTADSREEFPEYSLLEPTVELDYFANSRTKSIGVAIEYPELFSVMNVDR